MFKIYYIDQKFTNTVSVNDKQFPQEIRPCIVIECDGIEYVVTSTTKARKWVGYYYMKECNNTLCFCKAFELRNHSILREPYLPSKEHKESFVKFTRQVNKEKAKITFFFKKYLTDNHYNHPHKINADNCLVAQDDYI